MSKSKKVIAALGVAAVLGGSVIPLSSYAADPATDTETVTVTVADSIALAVTNQENKAGIAMQAGEINMSNGTSDGMIHKLVVTTNSITGYQISIKDSDTATALPNDKGATIPAKSGVLSITDGGWGYKTENDEVASSVENSNWNAISSENVTIRTDETVFTAKTPKTTFVRFGVATKADQASGTYTDTVTYTATVITPASA